MRASRPGSRRIPLLAGILLLLLAAALPACSSAWKTVPLASLDEATESLGGEVARFHLKDERVLEMRVSWVRYPWVEGHRLVGEWSTPRKLRVDLREVTKIEVRNAS